MEKDQEMEVEQSQQSTGSQPVVTADSRLVGEGHSTDVTDQTQGGTAEASATSETRDVPSEYVCGRFSGKTSHIGNDTMWWKCTGDADALGFKVDRDLLIVGVGIYPAREQVPWNVSVALLDTDGATTMTSAEGNFDGDGTTDIKTVRFPEPVKVIAGQTYTVKADISSPSPQTKYTPFKTVYGVNGRKIVNVGTPKGDVQFTFGASPLSTNQTQPASGQIPTIVFAI